MTGDGPTITQQTMLDYLNDRLDDPVTQQWMDQMLAATDELRAAAKIEAASGLPGDNRLPSPKAHKLMAEMWSRLRAESDANRCEHLLGRELQPTVIIPEERRQLCGECWHDYDWQPLSDNLPRAEARKIVCDGCGERPFKSRWDDDNGNGGIRTPTLQWWFYIATLRLCRRCSDTLRHDRWHVLIYPNDDETQ